jgi:Flp pilus assembly protein TadG
VLGLVLIFPAALGLAILVLWLGRQVDTAAQVQAASDAAAQAAARQRAPEQAVNAAHAVAHTMLGDVEACSSGPDVRVDVSQWRSSGIVTVTISCRPRTDDLRLIAASPAEISGTSVATLDRFRAGVLP